MLGTVTSMSWAEICKKANGGKHEGAYINQLERFDFVLSRIAADITKIAPLAEKTRKTVQRQTQKTEVKPKKARRANAFNPFLRLPYGIRPQIFDLIIEPLYRPVHLSSRRTGKLIPINIPAIALAHDRQTRLECLMLLLEKSVIEIHSGPALFKFRSFLQDIDFNELTTKNTSYNLGFDCIRTLRFPFFFFSRFPHATLPKGSFNNDVLMMRACKNLTSLYLNWVDEELTYINEEGGYGKKSIERVRKEYQLDGMLDLKKLKFLNLHSEVKGRVHRYLGDDVGHQQVVALGDWFIAEFSKRGMVVEVDAR